MSDLGYYCLDCGLPAEPAADGAEVTCAICGGFRMVPIGGE